MKPGSGAAAGLFSAVIVSPTGAPSISLMPAAMKPTSPAPSSRIATDLGVKRPSLSMVWLRPVDMTRIFSPVRRTPFTTRTSDTTPT